MQFDALLLDLDDTLIPDESAAEAAFLAACDPVHDRFGIDPAAVAGSAGECARELWRASDHIDYCLSIGISSWEGLWARFTGDAPGLRKLHAWTPTYRREAWRRALAQHDVDDPAYAEHLAERFRHERRKRNAMFPDAADLLPKLARGLPPRAGHQRRPRPPTLQDRRIRVCGPISRPSWSPAKSASANPIPAPCKSPSSSSAAIPPAPPWSATASRQTSPAPKTRAYTPSGSIETAHRSLATPTPTPRSPA